MLPQWGTARLWHYDFEREIRKNQTWRQENFIKSTSELEDEYGIDKQCGRTGT